MPSPRKQIRNPASGTVSDADYEHLAAFRNALREFLHFSEEAAIAAGVQPQQHQAMLIIRGNPDGGNLTVGDLAARLKIKHHSAVGLVNRMETEKFVVKTHHPRDRRQVLIRLTPLGTRTLEKLTAAHKAELVRIGPVLRDIFNHLKSVS